MGASLVRSLLERGDQVSVLDSGLAAGLAAVDGTPAEILAADIGDAPALDRALDRGLTDCDAIIHLAAQVSVPRSMEAPLDDMRVNVDASLRLLDAARRRGVRRFVFASSNAAVAGHQPPMHEGLVPYPVAPYGAAKASVEVYLRAYHRAYGLAGVALRFANAYGPWSAHKSSVVASFVKAFLRGGPLVIRGSGEQTRDFIHVDDVTRIIVACLDAPEKDIAGEVFQVGSGRETSLNELAQLLFEVGGHSVPIDHQPPSAGDVPRNVSDVSKAQRVLGWTPQVALRDGLAQTLDWFRGQRAD
ncbi:NAD-dependent epimerase/dehydratase family protein [soil metagenome]